MDIRPEKDLKLSEELKKELQLFCDDIVKIIPDKLGAIIVYGGLAKEEFLEGSSNINLMIVLKELNVQVLDDISPKIQKALFRINLVPFIIRETELYSSYNLFPIKFLDIKENHFVLWGKNYMADVDVSKEYLKRNCQRELKNLVLRLGQVYFLNYNFPEKLGLTLKKFYSSYLIDLNTLLSLKTGKSYLQKQEIIEAGIRDLGLEAEIMHVLLEYKNDMRLLKNAEVKEKFDEFLQLARTTSIIADNL